MQKAHLPWDALHLEAAKNDCNQIIQSAWYSVHAPYRQSRGQIVTVSGASEYVLNKYFDGFVKNTLQGPSTNPRRMSYMEPEEFFKKVNIHYGASGYPYLFTYGQMVGYDQQLNTASRIKVFSSLASKTTGSINVTPGSDRVTSSQDIFDLNDVGLRLKRSGDSRSYKIGRYYSPREIQLIEKYRGSSGSGVAYQIGDVGIHVNIMSFVGGQITTEDVELDGANAVLASKTSNTLVSLSKSDTTGGNITFQDSTGTQTVGTLAPAETEIERQTVVLWPQSNTVETLTYRHYMKHPALWLESDRILIPEKYHLLICYRLERKLRESFGAEVPQGLIEDINREESRFKDDSEDLSMTSLTPDEDGERYLGEQYYLDHF